MKMNTYKIKNITDKLGKRDVNHNSTLKIFYVDEMEKKTINLKPKETIYYRTNSLPLSIHKLRIKGLVSVEDINEKQIDKIKNNQNNSEKENNNTTTTTTTKKKNKKLASSKRKYTTSTNKKINTTTTKKTTETTEDTNE